MTGITEDTETVRLALSGGRTVAASGLGPGNAVARDVRLAEMLITGRTAPAAGELARPEVKLKSLLAR